MAGLYTINGVRTLREWMMGVGADASAAEDSDELHRRLLLFRPGASPTHRERARTRERVSE